MHCTLLLSSLLLLSALVGATTSVTDTPAQSTPLSSQVSPAGTGSRDFTGEVTRGTRGLFAPRVEYDEWTPLGHGDPLKNDPTYDYVPPVLERVRYWIEPPSRSPEPPIRQTHHQTQTPTHHHTNTYHHIPTTYLNTHSQRFPIQSTIQYNNNINNNYHNGNNNNADSRRDSYPFLTLVDGPKFNLPQSSPYKPHPPQQLQHQQSQQSQQQYQVVPRPPNHFSRPSLPYRTPPSQTAVRPMTTPTFPPTQPPTSWFDLNRQQNTRPPVVLLTPASITTSTVTPPITPAPSSAYTTQSALTTDPLFAHYKQPSEPLQGPMYLIIEGHSKVKTYGASKTIHGIPVDSNLSLRRQKRRKSRRRRKLRKRSAL